MKKGRIALALALLGLMSSLCLEGMRQIGRSLDRKEG